MAVTSISQGNSNRIGGFPSLASYGSNVGGTVDTTSRPGKTIVKFTGSGSITIANTGVVEVLVVGGGGGGTASGGAGGGGGVRTYSRVYLSAGTYTCTVGGGGAQSARSVGNISTVTLGSRNDGAITAPGGSWGSTSGAMSGSGFTTTTGAAGAGAGADSTVSGVGGAAYSSSITGSAVSYGRGGDVGPPVTKTANTGDGGDAAAGSASNGASGVIVFLFG